MERGVRGCDIMIAVVSPRYVKSRNCGREMAFCHQYRKTLIPLMMGISPAEWPPTHVGNVEMKDQFRDPATGDMKLYIDFTDVEKVYLEYVVVYVRVCVCVYVAVFSFCDFVNIAIDL